ncbi:MAG: thioredoxin family protein [Candidatus Hydrothermarchaeales archaeon]
MSEILLELFTTPTLPQCSTARKATNGALRLMNEALLIERDVSKKEDYQRALELGVREVPTLVVNEKYQIKGTPKTSEELVRFINHGIKK